MALDVIEFDEADGVRSVDLGRPREADRSDLCFLDDDLPLVKVKVLLLGRDFLGDSFMADESDSP